MDTAGRYAELGVDVQKAIETLKTLQISLHCWQGDDVGGFEQLNSPLGGGIQVTGNFRGKAETPQQLRDDLNKVYSMLPGRHRLNLHAIYGDFTGKTADRDKINPEHFQSWADWSMEQNVAIDFNPTCFSHPLAADGFTLSSKDKKVRDFWVRHVKKSREIAAFFAKNQKNPSVNNIWIPDGFKDRPADLYGHRCILTESLDEIFQDDFSQIRDAVEPKLFGIGSESSVIGSFEFYLGYALTRNKMICLDMGHFHPTESVADKISAILQYQNELLLHVSRPVRWDSDHVVILNDDLYSLALELIRSDALNKAWIGLDFFDGSINRIGAWVIGARSTLKAVLFALLEPRKLLIEYEESKNYYARMALMEEIKTLPFGEIWNQYCESAFVPTDRDLIQEVEHYEHEVLSKRS